MKIPFSIYFFLVINILYGQNEINVPKCEYVQTEEKFRLLDPLSLNNEGNLIIENNIIRSTNDFDKNISDRIVYQMFNKSLGYSAMKFEIQIDSSCLMEKIDSIFNFIAGRSFNKLFLVAETQTSSRIEGVLSTGFDYEVASIEIQNNLTNKIRNENGIPPPSPPPSLGWNMPFKYAVPTTYTVNNYGNNKDIIEVYKIEKLSNNQFSINNNFYNRNDFQVEIKKLIQYNFCAFELMLDRKASYSDFVELISTIKNELEIIRNKYANDKFSQDYYNLGYSDKINVVDAYPDLIQIFIKK